MNRGILTLHTVIVSWEDYWWEFHFCIFDTVDFTCWICGTLWHDGKIFLNVISRFMLWGSGYRGDCFHVHSKHHRHISLEMFDISYQMLWTGRERQADIWARVCVCAHVFICVWVQHVQAHLHRPQCQESAEKLSVCVCWGMCVWHNNVVWEELIAAPFVAPHCESMWTARLSQEILAWVIQEASLVLLSESLHEAYVKNFDGEQVHCPCVLCPRTCVYLCVCVCVCGCVEGHQYPPLCLRLLSAIGQWKPLCNLKCPKNKWRLLTSAPPPSLSVTPHLLSCCDFTVWVTGWFRLDPLQISARFCLRLCCTTHFRVGPNFYLIEYCYWCSVQRRSQGQLFAPDRSYVWHDWNFCGLDGIWNAQYILIW